MESIIIDKSEKFVRRLFSERLSNKHHFHDISHTENVVDAVNLIGTHEQLSSNEINLVTVAAWFHDTGFVHDFRDHENSSVAIAKQYLAQWNVADGEIELVIGCINATKLPQSPDSKLEEVICDADMFHLAQPNYWKKNSQLRKELEDCGFCNYSKREWLSNNASFLESHDYFTLYAKSELKPIKQKHLKENLSKLKNPER